MSSSGPIETTSTPRPLAQGAKSKSLRRWLLLGAGIALVISFLCRPGLPLYSYELKTIDSRFRFRAENLPAQNVVVVAIDERSLNDPRLGRWPWDRKWHAELINRLTRENPSAIAFDVIFSEPSSLASDSQLAAAMTASGRVFLALHTAEMPPRKDVAKAADHFAVQPGMLTGQQALPTFGGLIPPLPQFAQAAAGGGAIAAFPDPDGVVRRALLLCTQTAAHPGERRLYPSLLLSLAAGHRHWDFSRMDLNLRREAVLSPQTRVPLDGQGEALINFLGPADMVSKVSYVDVLDGRFPPRLFQGKIVLVGFTAPGLVDQYAVPLQPSIMSGVDLQAQTLENFLNSTFLKPSSQGNVLGLALVLTLIAAAAAASTRPVLGLAFVFLLLGAYNVAGLKAFTTSGAVWPGLAPNLSALLAFAVIAVLRLATEEKGRRQLREEFGRYAPPQVVARLDSGEMRERAAGVKRPVTSLFADVRGFTAWSANADPHAVIAVLNTYYESMTQLAFDLEGTVDNIVGDEIFVTFNAIEDQPDHVARAVDLAWNMIAALEGLNARWLAQGTLPSELRIGVGINTGEALVGSLGSRVRTQYTVLGQSVNLAARLQALNKDLGTTLVCSKEVADHVGGRFELKSHGMRDIRGHPVPVEVFEILGRKGA